MRDGHPRATGRGSVSWLRTAPGARSLLARAALAVALAVALTLVIPGSAGATAGAAARAASVQAVAVASSPLPAWTASDRLDLTVSPSSGLSPNGAEVTVRGSGYNSDKELWVAVCQDDGVAPEQFAHCLGGAIPNANASTSWAVVTSDGRPRYAGPVNAKFGGRGKFKVTLQIPVAAGQDADCISNSCSVYTRSADPADRSQDAAAGVRFTAPRPSSETAPSTEVVGGTPTSVEPDSIAAPEISPGDEQTVVFSTFTPGEQVDVTLYSDPISLPPTNANDAGVVTISFDVPADLPLGEHLVQAVGQSSGKVGVAAFSVVEPVVTTSETVATTTSVQVTTQPTVETLSEEAVAPIATADVTTTSPETVQSATTSPAAPPTTAAEPTDSSTGARLLWLWIMVAALLLIGGAAAAVAWHRRRRDLEDGGDASAPVAVEYPEPAPSWEEMRAGDPAAWTPQPDPGAGSASAESEGHLPGGLDHLFAPGAVAGDPQPGPPWATAHEPPPSAPAAGMTSPTDPAWHRPSEPPPPAAPPLAQQLDGGPATEQFRPVFDDPGDEADAADYLGDDEPAHDDPASSGRGRHHRID